MKNYITFLVSRREALSPSLHPPLHQTFRSLLIRATKPDNCDILVNIFGPTSVLTSMQITLVNRQQSVRSNKQKNIDHFPKLK